LTENTTYKSATELISDFATASKREVFLHEFPYPPAVPMYGVRFTQKLVFVKDNLNPDIFLIGFHDPKQFSETEMVFGVFSFTDLPLDFKVVIRERNFTDFFNRSLKKNAIYPNFLLNNFSTVVTGNNKELFDKIFVYHNKTVQINQMVKELLQIPDIFYFGINSINFDYVPPFKDKSFLGFYTTQKWITDPPKLELLFEKMRELKEILN
jgi:hypothetical protein